jgi:hypothetical protein
MFEPGSEEKLAFQDEYMDANISRSFYENISRGFFMKTFLGFRSSHLWLNCHC